MQTGLQHISISQALSASSQRLRTYLPVQEDEVGWSELIEAAYQLKSDLSISQKSWGEACQLLGRTGALICILLTDQATLRKSDPVKKPAAYFNGMIAKARAGELKLHKSIFGLLKG